MSAVRVGWIASSTLDVDRPTFKALPAPVAMRISNVARWINRHGRGIRNEMYRRGRRYDVVVLVKTMGDEAIEHARELQAEGTKIVFDANVNYYEVWGEYEVPGTQPTADQQRQARELSTLADWVVADSSYLRGVVERYTARVTWIPDNVDLRLFRRPRRHQETRPLRLVWSGVAKKGWHLLAAREAFAAAGDAELVLCAESEPEVMPELREVIAVRFVPFELRRYARLLRRCDVIVSPKQLVNAYELAHTEWKITLGMAAGLPAVASPQRSYVEAIEAGGGGIVARSVDEWQSAFAVLRDPARRADLGARAHRTVRERYSTPVVSTAYLELLRSLT